ncbi:MAG: thiamine pyrophosphate-dependent enzyme, partial [Hyphomicrobiaceae bacterium]
DEPLFTQPRMYQTIKAHPTTVAIYAKKLIDEGTMTEAEVDEMKARYRAHLDTEMAAADGYKPNKADWFDGRWTGLGTIDDKATRAATGVAIDVLKEVGRRLTTLPIDFNAHKTVLRLLERRREMVEQGEGIDWAMGEHLAYGTLLRERMAVRLSGQDVERGTFSQRHAVLIDQNSERRYTPLKYVSPDQGRFEVINSMLSEEAVLGFEYGYSLAEPMALTLWEAQFGDFANGAQVIFDQFLSSGERKWLRMSGLVCLLPHGYEGQGPEHSSARLERYLQLSAEDNWQVANCTTPANYFHILRRQLLRKMRKPLILMTPKSLLRHKRVTSKLAEFGPDTSFRRVLWDDADPIRGYKAVDAITLKPDAEIRRVVMCTGKVYYDLYEGREAAKADDVYILRVEQLYPFPARSIMKQMSRFPNADVVWCQEEPRNMGAWSFIEPNIEWTLAQVQGKAKRARYVGRNASASTATGQLSRHLAEQKAIVAESLAV